MARGKKYPDKIKEQAFALYAAGESAAEISRKINVPANTISTWICHKLPDKFDELRDENKKKFIAAAGRIIEKALGRLEKTIDNEDVDIPINHLTTAIGTLYDKRALAEGDSTENTVVTVRLPEEVREYAK